MALQTNILLVLLLAGALVWVARRTHEIRGKSVLVVGNSSLGLAFARILRRSGNRVAVSSLDINKFGIVAEQSSQYDYIFCCSATSSPAYFTDQLLEVFEQTMDTNYLGAVRILKHFSAVNKRPFRFIMVGSPLSLLSIPGYSSYSPSASALLSFFHSVYEEMRKLGIHLHFFNTSLGDSLHSSADDVSATSSDEHRAAMFLRSMMARKVVSADLFAHLCQARMDCETLGDHILFPVAVAVVCAARLWCKWRFRTRLA